VSKLEELISLCKCGVTVFINSHKDIYASVPYQLNDSVDEIDNDIYLKMVEIDTIINIHFYPDTPVGSVSIYHYDLDSALSLALDYFKQRETGHSLKPF
jgi:hypothetical protein